MKMILIAGFVSVFVLSCNGQESTDSEVSFQTEKTYGQIHRVSVSDFKSQLKEGVQLLDVRTAGEFSDGHIANAENIDIMESDFDQRVQDLDKEKPVYVYCRSGKRSQNASHRMKEMGFKEIYDLDGGILSWEKSGEKLE